MTLLAQVAGQGGLDAWAGGSLIVSIINGGVLGWLLLIGLPAKDKLLKEKDDLLAKTVNGLVETHRMSLKEIAAEFRTTNERILEHCDKEIERFINVMQGKNGQ